MELAIEILVKKKNHWDCNLKFNEDMKRIEKEIVSSNEPIWGKMARLMRLGDPLPYNEKEHKQIIEAINQLKSIQEIGKLIEH